MSTLEQRERARGGPPAEERTQRIAEVLTAVVGLSREVRAGRPPFVGRHLSRSHVDLLYVLAHHPGPVTPSRMAAVLGLTAGAVTQLVDVLEADGLLSREAHPSDARSRILRLTPNAEAEIAAFERQVVAGLVPRFAALTDRQLISLTQLLRRLSPP